MNDLTAFLKVDWSHLTIDRCMKLRKGKVDDVEFAIAQDFSGLIDTMRCNWNNIYRPAPPVIMIPDQDGTVQVRSSGRIGLKADYGSNATWLMLRVLQGCACEAGSTTSTRMKANITLNISPGWAHVVALQLVWRDALIILIVGFLIVPGSQWYSGIGIGEGTVEIMWCMMYFFNCSHTCMDGEWRGYTMIYCMRMQHACMNGRGIGLVGLVIICSFSPPPLGSSVWHYRTRMDRPRISGQTPKWAVTLRRNVWTTFQSSLAFFRGPH